MEHVFMNNNFLKAAEELKNIPKSKEIIKHSFKEIIPNKENILDTVIFLLLGTIFAIFMGFSNDTIKIFKEFIGILLNIQLIVFGFIFSIYSIILAFFSDEYIKKIVRIESENKETMLKTLLTYYESVLYMYFINVAITGIIEIALLCIPDDFGLCSNKLLNCFLATFLMSIYNSYSFRVFYELKSTIYNTINIFRTSIAYRLLSFAENCNKDENK